jgi:hypothetical protein
MASNRIPFDQLVDRFTPDTRAAFLAAYDRIKANVTRALLKRIASELERGNIEAAIDLLGIDRAAFGGLELAIANAFNSGGIVMADELALRGLDGHRVSVSFGIRNLVAEAILRDFSASEVTRETEATKALLRVGLSEGLARGDNPTRTALDMVGRVNRVTGVREGGYLGLSGPQEQTQAKALSAMLSGDTEGMKGYLDLKQRDKRFDAMVRKASTVGWDQVVTDFNKRTKGKPVTARDLQTRIIGRLNDGQLKYRADKVALHETMTALSMAKNEGIRQAIESGNVDQRDVTKGWLHTSQEHPRMQHVTMQGQVVAFDQPFVAPDGTLIAYPHAPGVPLRHTLGCKCGVSYKIDFTAALIRRSAGNG